VTKEKGAAPGQWSGPNNEQVQYGNCSIKSAQQNLQAASAPQLRQCAQGGAAMSDPAVRTERAVSKPTAAELRQACLDLLREHERAGDIPTNPGCRQAALGFSGIA
jgi:hypothetical protein